MTRDAATPVVGEENVMNRRLIVRGAPAGIAALALVLGACDADSTADDASPGPNSSNTPTPTSTPADPAPTDPAPTDLAPTDQVTYSPGPGEVVSIPRDDSEAVVLPGRYALRLDKKLGYEVDVPDKRFADEGVYLHTPEAPGVFAATTAGATTRLPRHPCTDLTGVPVGPGAAALANAVAAQPDLVTSEPEPVTLGGASGYYLEIRIPENDEGSTCGEGHQLFRTGTTTWSWGPGLTRWWILDLDGSRVVVMNFCDRTCTRENLQKLTTMAESVTFTTGS
jgi:hypothetical protein